MREHVVIIVGAGPSGLATSACLNQLFIPNLVIERDDCSASLWKKRSYDRLNLHLGKEFCELPHFPFPPDAPAFISKKDFIKYIDDYSTRLEVEPLFSREVTDATFDRELQRWIVHVTNTCTNNVEYYTGRFLVVATGENSDGVVPEIPGLPKFEGEVLHSSRFKSGREYRGQNVLVVGCGNSGMEIALDLSNHGVKTSIVVRNPIHVMNKELIHMGMRLLRYFPMELVDRLMVSCSKRLYGDTSKFGILRPEEGPFLIKNKTGRSPMIDQGTIKKIKSGDIKVVTTLACIKGNEVEFSNNEKHVFDAVILATGYKSTIKAWLKDDDGFFIEDGMPRAKYPNHWRGPNGLYCVGLSRRGLFGVSEDAVNISNDIYSLFKDGLKLEK
ncbi:probable indole-3-pyruvate monooxygenase YUCCA11 [Amborella trichopoda]|uniref:probable indole-3-pyruvate monooxygenase YUCCA11 n=1 Tax=Amborella trichopoda TaxID=13333 RepID=UPI0009C0BC53|nr:probable indole-3-pyruvate monooxygenase YUCCA11 [Amborella trichopoda]|eukprot:XP_020529616.1 probable indole-3-pyruvate monooxygenase YUCCA11 [Amborella trichopoda]